MKGGHDLGGQVDMGPVNPEPEAREPVFHAQWERRVFALTLATGMLGKWNIDESRHARERQDPLTYLHNSYYENWLEGLKTLLEEKGLLQAEEMEQATANPNSQLDSAFDVPSPERARAMLSAGASSLIPEGSEPLFQVGNRVSVRPSEPSGHTRVPRYAQGASGVIVALRGNHSYPDSSAAGIPEGRQLYTVSFAGQELWGDKGNNTEVLIDLWEPYLELAAI